MAKTKNTKKISIEEALKQRDALVAEQHKIEQAIKCLGSDTFPSVTGIDTVVDQYKHRLAQIDSALKALASACEAPKPTKKLPTAILTIVDEPDGLNREAFEKFTASVISLCASMPADATIKLKVVKPEEAEAEIKAQQAKGYSF